MKEAIAELKAEYLDTFRRDWRAHLDGNRELKALVVRRESILERRTRFEADITELEGEKVKALEAMEEVKKSFGMVPALQANGKMEGWQIRIESLDRSVEALRKLLAPGSELSAELKTINHEIAESLRQIVSGFTAKHQAEADEKRADCLAFLAAFSDTIGPVWNEFKVDHHPGHNARLGFGNFIEFERFMDLPMRLQ